MYIGLHVTYPLFLSDFNETWIISTACRKILKCQTSWKSVQCESSCSMRTEWETQGKYSLLAVLRTRLKTRLAVTIFGGL